MKAAFSRLYTLGVGARRGVNGAGRFPAASRRCGFTRRESSEIGAGLTEALAAHFYRLQSRSRECQRCCHAARRLGVLSGTFGERPFASYR